VTFAKATGSVTVDGVLVIRLKRKGSTETQKSRRMFRLVTRLVSSGNTDMMRVYRSHIVIRMRKLKPNVARSFSTAPTSVGGLLTSEIAPTERARPKIRSASDSILARGFWGLSSDFVSGPRREAEAAA
jgi:hypothetical protein